MGSTAKADHKPTVAGMSPVLAVQAFHGNRKTAILREGCLELGRRSQHEDSVCSQRLDFAITNSSHTAVEGRESPYDGLGVLPGLYNVVDSARQTGIIVGDRARQPTPRPRGIFATAFDLRQMNILQSIAAGE